MRPPPAATGREEEVAPAAVAAKAGPRAGKRAAVYVSLNYQANRPQKLLADSQLHCEENYGF